MGRFKMKVKRGLDNKYRKMMFNEMVKRREKGKKLKIIVLVLIGLWLASFMFGKVFDDSVGDRLAVIPIEGVITAYSTNYPFGNVLQSKDVVGLIEGASEKKNVKAILLEINSPGGTAVGSKEVVNAVKKVDKPVVALIREIGTSGAYWIASASDYIITDEMSLTGSIGVTGGFLEFGGLMEEYGVGYEELKAGKYKDIGNPFEKLNEEERNILEKKLEIIHENFIIDVAENRNLDVNDVKKVAEGLYYLGVEAKEFGLVDGFGGLEEAKEKAEELAGVELKEIVYKKKKGFFDMFGGFGLNGFYSFGRGFGDSVKKGDVNSFVPKVQ